MTGYAPKHQAYSDVPLGAIEARVLGIEHRLDDLMAYTARIVRAIEDIEQVAKRMEQLNVEFYGPAR